MIDEARLTGLGKENPFCGVGEPIAFPFKDEVRSNRRVDETIVLIEKRRLIGECLARWIGSEIGCTVKHFVDVENLGDMEPSHGARLVILSDDAELEPEIVRNKLEARGLIQPDTPFIILSDSTSVEDFCRSLAHGARGHLPTSVALEVGLEALRFVLAGGVFVPADNFIGASAPQKEDAGEEMSRATFTARQSAVVKALRHGKPNKVIAHDLNMSESTVKVHIHNIMRKLGARNRTEVALMAGAPGMRG